MVIKNKNQIKFHIILCVLVFGFICTYSTEKFGYTRIDPKFIWSCKILLIIVVLNFFGTFKTLIEYFVLTRGKELSGTVEEYKMGVFVVRVGRCPVISVKDKNIKNFKYNLYAQPRLVEEYYGEVRVFKLGFFLVPYEFSEFYNSRKK